ncbi:hypothetical protein HDU92_000546, partial [Lobulomyces angularis]
MGNGAKAAEARKRNQKVVNEAKSQTKTNEQAKTVQCKVCLLTFLCTVKEVTLKQHVENK